MYPNPIYELKDVTLKDYEKDGRFYYPDVINLIKEECNKESNEDITNYWAKTLQCFFVEFEKYYFIPVGTQCVLLDSDTMLVGIWGKIILAHRI